LARGIENDGNTATLPGQPARRVADVMGLARAAFDFAAARLLFARLGGSARIKIEDHKTADYEYRNRN
jgi:hypothetical protein